jgi:1-acyl-sn-glycerol-3-phosphate acyltransferase
VLKDSLKRVPLLGAGMQLLAFIFLARNWAVDEASLSRGVRYSAKMKPRFALLLFPEGTNVSADNLQRSAAFAKERGLALYSHVLHPRTTGFARCVAELQACRGRRCAL